MPRTNRSHEVRGVWSVPEHERFIAAMALYPRGPWKLITDYVGSRSIKQVQTHAQKYQQKLMRHQRGLRKRKTKLTRPEHRVDAPTLGQFTHRCIVRYAQRVSTTEAGRALQLQQSSEEENDEEDDDEAALVSSPAASETSESEGGVSASPLSFEGLHLVGGLSEEWAETAEDIANDPKFMHLMVDVDPVVPTYASSYDRLQDWTEWQFDELLKPFEDSPFVEGASQMHTRQCTV